MRIRGSQKGGDSVSYQLDLLLHRSPIAGTLTCCSNAVEYSLTAEFTEGDPAFDWILAFLVSSSICFNISCFDSQAH